MQWRHCKGYAFAKKIPTIKVYKRSRKQEIKAIFARKSEGNDLKQKNIIFK